MSIRTSTSILALAVAILSAPAGAADLKGGLKDPYAPAEVSSDKANFTGLWIGAFGGYQINTNELNYSDHEKKTGYVNDWKANINGLGSQGFMGELAVGFDKQIGSGMLVGVFAGVNVDNAEWTASLSSVNTPGVGGGAEVSFEKEWGGVLGARVGLIRGNTLFAIGGGWAFGEMGAVQGTAFTTGPGAASKTADLFKDQDTDLSGWFVQGEIEHSLGNGLFVNGLARYTDYGALDLTQFNNTATRTRTLELDRDELAAMVGLKYKFGFGN